MSWGITILPSDVALFGSKENSNDTGGTRQTVDRYFTALLSIVMYNEHGVIVSGKDIVFLFFLLNRNVVLLLFDG